MTRKIALVDDDDANALTLAALLEDEGYTVVSASSCACARSLIEGDERFVAFLLDARLGDGSGLDLVPLIRARRPGVPVLLVTGSIETDRPEAMGDVDAIFTKGGASDELCAMLAELLVG